MLRRIGWVFLGFLMLALAPATRPVIRSAEGQTGATGSTPHPCTTHIDIPERATWLPEGHSGGDEMQRGNSIEVVVWWEGGDPGQRKHLTVDLFPSHIPGMCLNSGSNVLDDFTIEGDVNPDWELGPDLPYSGSQSLHAETKSDYAAGERVSVIVHCYDWRGFFTIQGVADECEPASSDAPQDTDGDTLPDAYEIQTFLWTTSGFRIPYNPNSRFSDPASGVSDDLSDADLDVPPSGASGAWLPPIVARHLVRGDGLTAWEEYSAVRIGDQVKRTINWQDEGPNGAMGGPDVKEAWIHDEEANGLFKLFVPGNPYLTDFGVAFHHLEAKNITADGDNAGFVKKHPRGPKAQRVIRLHRADNKDKDAKLGDAGEFQVGAVPVAINVRKIQDKAADYGVASRDLADWVVAHEIGHKFSLEHNKRSLDKGAEPAVADRTNWWEGKKGSAYFWIPVFKGKSGVQELDLFEDFDPGQAFKRDGVLKKPDDQKLTLHTRDHEARIFSVTGVKGLAAPKAKVESHEGNLMDPVPDPGELANLKAQQLTNAQRAKINVTSP